MFEQIEKIREISTVYKNFLRSNIEFEKSNMYFLKSHFLEHKPFESAKNKEEDIFFYYAKNTDCFCLYVGSQYECNMFNNSIRIPSNANKEMLDTFIEELQIFYMQLVKNTDKLKEHAIKNW